MGLYFEDFDLDSSTVSRGRTITEADIVNFAGLLLAAWGVFPAGAFRRRRAQSADLQVAESGIGLITNMSSSAPYEELRLKGK